MVGDEISSGISSEKFVSCTCVAPPVQTIIFLTLGDDIITHSAMQTPGSGKVRLKRPGVVMGREAV
jgi:hypothetical protein